MYKLIYIFILSSCVNPVESSGRRPRISKDKGWKSQRKYIGHSVTLSCVDRIDNSSSIIWIQSKSRVTNRDIEWYRKHREFNDTNVKVIKNNPPRILVNDITVQKREKLENGVEITLTHVTSGDSGRYMCIANNSYGIDKYWMILDVIEKSAYRNITSWNVSYSHWNSSSCPSMTIKYTSNVPLESNAEVFIQLEGEGGFEDKYICNNTITSGYCTLKDINNIFSNNDNTTFLLFMLYKGTKVLLKNFTHEVKYNDIRGPIHLQIKDINIGSVNLKFYRPWLSKCDSYVSWSYFQTELCPVGTLPCNTTDMIELDKEDGINCQPAKQEYIGSGEIFICSYSVKKLQPNMNYSYRLKYSLDPLVMAWSTWSNNLTFTTKSRKPSYPLSIHCKTLDSSIKVTWEVPLSKDASTKIERFIIKTSGGTTVRVEADPSKIKYEYIIKTSPELQIEMYACSNSGCSVSPSVCGSTTQTGKQKRSVYLYVIISLVVVMFIWLMLAFGYFINKRQHCRRVRNSLYEDGEILIEPRPHDTVLQMSNGYQL